MNAPQLSIRCSFSRFPSSRSGSRHGSDGGFAKGRATWTRNCVKTSASSWLLRSRCSGSLSASAFPWPQPATTSARTTRRPRPTRSGPNMSGPTCCLPPMGSASVCCCGTTSTSEFCSIRPATDKSFSRSMPAPLGCRPTCGPPSVLRPWRSRHYIVGLVVSGMNDVLNSQGYTQAGYWNQIPTGAWVLMAAIGIGCNLLVGYGSRSAKTGSKLLPILPLIVSIAFMLIADIDSPRHGIIRVRPQNLISLAESLSPR